MRIVAFFAFCCLIGNLNAEQEFSFESTPGNLPKTIIPRHYVIHLEPDENQMTIDGAEAVEIEVLKSTHQILMNAVNMKIWNATLTHSGAREKLVPQLDDAAQQLKFTTAQDLRPGTYTLSFCFRSQINTESRGLFLQRYRSDGKTEAILATQMQPDKARQMFPCWDEPAFRGTFQLSVKIDKKDSAVSNMPDVAEQPIGNDKKIVIFGRTPPMSTYLVALICGRLESIEDQVDGVRLRVFTIPGKGKLGAFALENSRKLLSHYRDYFGIPYPLPKLDQIALPQNFGGVVENWGVIAYDENLLLYDSLNSASQAQEQIFATMARAIAHQWFGDLVTMAWWNNRWLSESLASWMGNKAEEKLHPEWRGWLRATADREQAMRQDERNDTHPIQPPVNQDQEIDEGFNNIIRWKGQYVIRMLEGFLGDEDFREGIRLYLKQNQFSNATATNLWAALEKTSGRSVGQIVSPWLTEPGFPLVRVTAECVKGKQVVTLEQSRFTIDPTATNNQQWIIPVSILSTFDPHRPSYALLDKISQTFDFPDCLGALDLNANDLGFYRVWYDPDLFAKLLREWGRLSEEERVDVVSDIWAMVISNRSPVASYLTLLENLEGETSYSVWHNILQTLVAIDRLEQGQPGRATFQTYVCSLLNPLLERIGWYPTNDEELATKLFRNELIEALGAFGDRSVINEAFERFEQMLKDPNSVNPELRGAVTRVVGRYSSERVYSQLHQLARDATLLEAKDDFYHAMESALDPSLAGKTLELAAGEELSPAESANAFAEIALEGEHADLAWNFVKARLDRLEKDRPQTLWTVLVPAIVEGMYDRQAAEDIVEEAKNRASGNGLVRTTMAADLLQARAQLRERLLPDIDDWVRKRSGTRVEAIPKSPAADNSSLTAAATPYPKPTTTPELAISIPTPTPEPTAVKIVISPATKGAPVPAAPPPAVVVNPTPRLPAVLAPTPSPSEAEESLSAIRVTPQPSPTIIPQPTATLVSPATPTPTPSPSSLESPVPVPTPVESPAPVGSPPPQENASMLSPSPTVSPLLSPTVQKRTMTKHSATPKATPTPTPKPTPAKPKSMLGQFFDTLRKANQEASKPSPTPTVHYWATPKPRTYQGSPTPEPQ